MLVLSIGIFALVAGFSSGFGSINRASKSSTAGTLADQQMESFRRGRLGRDCSSDPRAQRRPDADGRTYWIETVVDSMCPYETTHRLLGELHLTGSPVAGVNSRPVKYVDRDRAGRLPPRSAAHHRVFDVRSVYRLGGRDMAAFTYDAINAQGLESPARSTRPTPRRPSSCARADCWRSRCPSARRPARAARGRVQEGQAEVAPDLRAAARDDDRGRRERRRGVRDPRGADRRQVPAEIIGEIRSDVEAGMVLSRAFARHPRCSTGCSSR